ncbi:MAG TPA: M43 family zinc metalloprotease [Cyclobacteriaceae bacterium]|nr:M43 family zinc metalloprotease [Cyclobacteriaceae bacterium]
MRFVSILLLLLCCNFLVEAQEKCGTVPYMDNLFKKKGLSQRTDQFEQWLQTKISQRKNRSNLRTQAGPYKIPVVVHVIHNGTPIGSEINISDAQIISQLEVLNKDFKRLNSDAGNTPPEFLSVAGSLNIEFVFAKQTPEGLPTTGIVRVNGIQPSWSVNQDEELKAVSYWPSEDYLNIWVTNLSGGYLGYAQFPVSNLEGLEEFHDGIATTDGVVIDYTVFGVGASDPDYNLGRTTTHEVAHYFGLRHIWGDESTCSGTDYVNDTPNQLDETYGCPTHPANECSGSKMFQNFMDYTDDVCMNLFTQGQVDRMTVILEDPAVPRRSSLLNSHGLEDPTCGSNSTVDVAITGVMEPGPVTCNDDPELILNVSNLGCPIVTSIKVEYNINNGPTQSITATGLSIFNDGSEAQINVGKLTLPVGVNSIAVKAALVNGEADALPGNSEATVTITRNTATDLVPFRKTFDDNKISSWTTANPQAGTLWNIDNELRAEFRTQGSVGEQSWLVSPVLNLSLLKEASLFFDLSYLWNGQDNDQLKILASTDCGDSYYELDPGFNLQGSELSSNNERKYVSISSLTGREKVRLAFVATNASGNNIYVDNIEFFVTDNPNPIDPQGELYAVYWNASAGVDITFNLPERQKVGVALVDMMGREIERGLYYDILNQTISMPFQSISTGLYVIRLQIGSNYYATKVYLSP